MYGVIDIGSNTIRLVVYKLENKTLLPMINKKYSVGLAGYISDDNYLKTRGVDKAIEALADFKEILECLNVEEDEIFPFATAPFRNIANSDEVLRKINDKTGFDVRILTSTGDYALKEGDHSINYQELMLENTYKEEFPEQKKEESKDKKTSGFISWLRRIFGRN